MIRVDKFQNSEVQSQPINVNSTLSNEVDQYESIDK